MLYFVEITFETASGITKSSWKS